MLVPLLVLTACGGGLQRSAAVQAAPGQPAMVATDAVPTGVANSCGARRHGSLVGKDATVLETVLLMGPVQVVRPEAVTAQDFQPDRINFIIGADNRIARITCG